MSIKEGSDYVPVMEPLDIEGYAPFFLTTIANRWTAAASRSYLREFEIGVAEWRVLAALSVFGRATSLEVVSLISMDAGAVSRAMKVLHAGGFVEPVVGRFKGRSKPFEMTEAGRALYRQIRFVAYQREDVLLRSLDQTERRTLLTLLRKIHADLKEL